MTKIMFADDLLGTFVLGLEITAEHPEAARNTLQEMIAGACCHTWTLPRL